MQTGETINARAAGEGRADALAALFSRHGSERLIANLRTSVRTIEIGDWTVPLTVNNADGAPNCYLCKPTTAFVDYALEETSKFGRNAVVRTLTKTIIHACAPIVRATGLDRHVQVNNWLLSTNPAPSMSVADASELRDRLLGEYPDHAIIMRSLNDITDKAAIASLASAGFQMVPARQVYIFDGRKTHHASRDRKRDKDMLRRSGLEVVSGAAFTEKEFRRAETLYAMLYLEKYTALNPQYTALFLGEAQRAGLLELKGLRARNGDLQAVVAFFKSGDILTVPIVGYDTAVPQTAGLYRMAMALALDEALTEGLCFNMSAGASSFKRNRGAAAAVEYSAVYVAHRSRSNRVATGLAGSVLRGIGVPLLKRYEL